MRVFWTSTSAFNLLAAAFGETRETECAKGIEDAPESLIWHGINRFRFRRYIEKYNGAGFCRRCCGLATEIRPLPPSETYRRLHCSEPIKHPRARSLLRRGKHASTIDNSHWFCLMVD